MDKDSLANIIDKFSGLLDEYTSMGLIDMDSYDYEVFSEVERILSQLLKEKEK